MATQSRIDQRTQQTNGPIIRAEHEPQMRELLKQLAADGGDLVRGEVALAKLEMRDMARQLATDSATVGAAIALAMAGALTLVAAATIGLGTLLDGRYALAALITGVLTLLIGGILARNGLSSLKNGNHRPDETVRSLKRDREWASRELKEFKQEMRS